MQHIPFPEIERFRHLVKEIGFNAAYTGRDANGEPIYDFSLPKPKILFHGTVKLHGTNGGVTWRDQDGIYAQSREIVLTPGNDNKGFARFVDDNNESFVDLFSRIVTDHNVEPHWYVTIFGEWVGKGIVKKMAVSNIDKSFFIFGVKATNPDDPEDHKWLPCDSYQDPINRIFNVANYTTFNVEIDFENPEPALAAIEKAVLVVEEECPVGAGFGHKGMGEGIVFTGQWRGKNYRFKGKGEKHEVVNTKQRVTIAPEMVESRTAFADYAVGRGRVEQAISVTLDNTQVPSLKDTGMVLKWVCEDVLKEEADVLKANGFEWKDVQGFVSTKARTLFFEIMAERAQLASEHHDS